MPEGPEHFFAAKLIADTCRDLIFHGKVEKSELATNKSKHPDVDWKCDQYKITACSRGKEVKLTLSEILITKSGKSRILKFLNLVFQFGMSGSFRWCTVDDIPKHAHLRFLVKDGGVGDKQVLCYHDPRRFGKWRIGDNWSEGRGPDPVSEYDQFRVNVINNISDKIFNRPICETLLNQKYFNGVGNYLRAEILYKAKIAPFERARDVVEELISNNKSDLDILHACSTIMHQARDLYDKSGDDYTYIYSGQDSTFSDWVQCYGKTHMKSLVDSNGRTIWFDGKPGPMAPKNRKTSNKSGGKIKLNKDVKNIKKETSREPSSKSNSRIKLKKQDLKKNEDETRSTNERVTRSRLKRS